MDSMTVLLVVGIGVLVFLLFVFASSIRIVSQWERMVVKRWGTINPGLVRDPGIRFLIPFVDVGLKVDIREQFIEVPRQTAITKDNAPLSVDFLIYWKIVDPLMSIVNVANFSGALQGVAATSLRSVIGDIPLDDVLSQRERINEGEKNGTLTKAQGDQLKANDRAIKQQEHAEVKANGGHLTKAQQKQLNQEENANSKLIHDEKNPAGQ